MHIQSVSSLAWKTPELSHSIRDRQPPRWHLRSKLGRGRMSLTTKRSSEDSGYLTHQNWARRHQAGAWKHVAQEGKHRREDQPRPHRTWARMVGGVTKRFAIGELGVGKLGSTMQVIIRETSEQQQKLCYGLSTKALISISPKSPDSETVYPVSYNVFYV